jgi:hypothetical protein
VPRRKVIFARFIGDSNELVAVGPSVGDLPVDLSQLERGTMRFIPMNLRSANSTILAEGDMEITTRFADGLARHHG